MMRAPILPQGRERLWSVIAGRLDAIEAGLQLVLAGLDCSGGQHGAIEGLARDGSGAPVLVLLAVDGDALFVPRVLSAADFLARIGDALVTAVPEGHYCHGAKPRVVVIGTEQAAASLRAVQRLGLARVEICRLEPFKLAGAERFAVTWLGSAPGTACAVDAEPTNGPAVAGGENFEVGLAGEAASHWQMIRHVGERLDPGVRFDTVRRRCRITWNGRLLGQLACADGTLRAAIGDGSEVGLTSRREVRAWCDRLVRRFAEFEGILPAASSPAPGAEVTRPADEPRSALGGPYVHRSDLAAPVANGRMAGCDSSSSAARDTLRAALADALLSPEEFAALAQSPDATVTDPAPD
ncbi:MAG: hypothetical protein KDE27_13820 [Planctomycetes bacterium]|nr:hypothetical protein [Planctomycetota bacterium]